VNVAVLPHNLVEIEKQQDIHMFSYLQVLENYSLWYRIYSSCFGVMGVRNSCGSCV
jgi:hypothetical protein